MRIESSVVGMSSKTSLLETHTKEESLRFWTNDESAGQSGSNPPQLPPPDNEAVSFELSERGKALIAQWKNATAKTNTDNNINDSELPDLEDQKIQLLEKFIEALTGKKIKLHVIKDIKIKQPDLPNFPAQPVQTPANRPTRQGWGLDYSYHESHQEQEKLSFTSSGTVKTADGREINFDVQLNMSREFASQENISVKAGDALLDPLVINFDSAGPQLTDKKFTFDLDCNGKADQISFVKPGSGFLALDKNGDGVINDGSELFGPKSGDGFGDLAKYDSDGNNWIDENDPIYDKLRIWTKDENGNDQLFALGQKGIGAIYLGNVDTQFSLKSTQNNELQGQVKETGIFLRENGTAGTIQHIDLSI